VPFDPALPVSNAGISSAELRNQFNELKALIDSGATQQQLAGGTGDCNLSELRADSLLYASHGFGGGGLIR